MRKNLTKTQGPTAVWLLSEIERFLTSNDMENDGYTFGWHVAKDRMLVTRLRDGGDVTLTRMDDILAFMQNPVCKREILKPMKIKPKELP